MTFTVESKSKVSAAGEWPYGMDAYYANTYQKGDVRAGDTAVLVVNGLDGIAIEKIDIYLRSNKDKGAGIVSISADSEIIFQQEGTYKEWFGAYDNTNYQPLIWSGSRTMTAGSLQVQIIGTTNSLHIEKYEITWDQKADPHTVTLMNGNTQYDELSGTEVTLPSLPDTDEWQFIGWTDIPFYVRNEWLPSLLAPGSYKPANDITLWAVYSHKAQMDQLIATDLRNGAYLYADRLSKKAMSGGVVNGVAESAEIDITDTNQQYEITFYPDSTATIRQMYVYGEEYIGFYGTQLANTPSRWKVYHEGQKTAFYTMVNDAIYMLLPASLHYVDNDYFPCAELQPVSKVESTTTVLLNAESAIRIYLTCYPEVGFGIDEVNAKECEGALVIPFGNYELHIHKGKKYLRLR